MRPTRMPVLITCLLAVLVGCGAADPVSPGELAAFVSLGPGEGDLSSHRVELDGDSGQDLYRTLSAQGAAHLDEVRAALDERPVDGVRAFAFVLPGCAETGAELVMSDGHLDAELTGGENTNCAAAVYFLATFRIQAELVPPGN